MSYSQPIVETIRQRFSCRTYGEEPIDDALRRQLAAFITAPGIAPFGTRVRFELLVATSQDRDALKGLGTYGFIQGATGFIVGATEHAEKDLEDLGYLMERIVLYATDLGLGTCWLGGTFTRSRFAERIALRADESLPAVVPVGYVADRRRLFDILARRVAGSDKRLPWEQLFFEGSFRQPLSRETAGPYAVPLDMVRLAPSASNRQPWRFVLEGQAWHLYLRRTPGYARATAAGSKTDLQRIDMGIAMSHFELTARELGLPGAWHVGEPAIERPDVLTEYVASWIEDRDAR